MQDEVRSKRLRVRRDKSEENVADLGSEPLSKAVIAKHSLTLGYSYMAEDSAWCKLQNVAMFWDFGSMIRLKDNKRAQGHSDRCRE